MALHLKSTGIDFADFGDTTATGASTTSELLDDYEEGTWAPTGTHVGVATNHISTYVKTGRQCTMQYDVTRDAHNDAAQATALQAAPFATTYDSFSMDWMDSNNTHVAATWGGNGINFYDQNDHISMTRGEIGSKRHRSSFTGSVS